MSKYEIKALEGFETEFDSLIEKQSNIEKSIQAEFEIAKAEIEAKYSARASKIQSFLEQVSVAVEISEETEEIATEEEAPVQE